MPLPHTGPAGTSGAASTHALPHPAPPSSPAVPVVVPAAPAAPRKPVPPAPARLPAVPPPPPVLPALPPPVPCASGLVRSDFVPAQARAVMNNVETAIRYSGAKRFTLDTSTPPSNVMLVRTFARDSVLSAADFNRSFREFRHAGHLASHRVAFRACSCGRAPGGELSCRAMSTNTKHAVVTGAGSGIGRAAALALLADGYHVALAGRRPEPLHATAQAAGEGQGRALVVPTDVRSQTEVRGLFARAKQAFGRVDVLFNNAGVGSPAAAFEDLTIEQWRGVIDVNLTGMFLCAQEAFRVMRDQSPRGGRIINNGSLSAYAPRPSSAPYTASKHAITGLTKCIALDGRKHDITCSQLDIGNAVTDLTERMERGVPQANGALLVEPRMEVASVGRSVVHIANLPPDANILFMPLMATKMPFVGRG